MMTGDTATYSYNALEAGDPIAPLLKDIQAFQTRLDPYAGRPLLLCLLPSIRSTQGRAALDLLAATPGLDSLFAARVLVTADAGADAKAAAGLFNEQFIDRDFRVLRALGAAPREAGWSGDLATARAGWIALDPSLHVLRLGPFTPGPLGQATHQLPAELAHYAVPRPPPVLMLPNVFSPALCAALVAAFDRNGGTETGVVINNQTVLVPDLKRRRDYFIAEPDLLKATHVALARRIIPEVERLFFMKLSRITRNIVACYSAEDGAHFLRPHRDNVAPDTAHRRFAVSVNLTDGFEGGEVVFPEYGPAGYKAPAGWALIFPCNIVHLVTRVEAGSRYVWLPFLYE